MSEFSGKTALVTGAASASALRARAGSMRRIGQPGLISGGVAI
jgi:hypothetical protein